MLTSRIKAHGRAFSHIAAFHPELTDDTRLHELFVEHLSSTN